MEVKEHLSWTSCSCADVRAVLPVGFKKKPGWQKSVENMCRHVAPFFDEHFVDECNARSCVVSVLCFHPEKARVGDGFL
jgi:hypothetical protein